MKKYYALGGIPTARQIKGAEGAAKIKAFVKKTGYPVIAKPDNGMGAGGTTKITCAEDLSAWLEQHAQDMGFYVIEEFITGLLVSYDAIFNSKGEPVFENNTVFPTPIMEIVHNNLDCCYWTNKTVPAKLSEIGRRTVNAFGIKSRFVHLEFFQLDRDREGLGKKGDYVGLEVNMRPPGGYTPDMMNYAHNTDVYQIWADMVAFDEARKPLGDSCYIGYAGRRDNHAYKHSHEDIMARYGSDVRMAARVPDRQHVVGGALLGDADHRKLLLEPRNSFRDHCAALVEDKGGADVFIFQSLDDLCAGVSVGLLLRAEGQVEIIFRDPALGERLIDRGHDGEKRPLRIQRAAPVDAAVLHLRAERIACPAVLVRRHHVVVGHEDGGFCIRSALYRKEHAAPADLPVLRRLPKVREALRYKRTKRGKFHRVRTIHILIGDCLFPDHFPKILYDDRFLKLHYMSPFPYIFCILS